MKACAHCGTSILFGGRKNDGQTYCNDTCMERGTLVLRSRELPPEVVARAMAEVVDGNCPVCDGPGPVDVFVSHRVISALVATTWKTIPRISCRGCATKAQLGNTLTSFLLGWWGFPWGLLMTPVQIVRNLAGLSREADREHPSEQLESLVRMKLATQAQVEPAPRRAA